MNVTAAAYRFASSRDDGSVVVSVTDDRGLLHLLHAAHDPIRRNHRWIGLATGGHRDLQAQHGTFVLGEGDTPAQRVVACATNGSREFVLANECPHARDFLSTVVPTFEGQAKAQLDRITAVCGAGTLTLAIGGLPGRALSSLDHSFGPDEVDRTLIRFPSLTEIAIQAHSATGPRNATNLAVLFGRETDPVAFTRAAWSLAEVVTATRWFGPPPYAAGTEPPMPEAGVLRRFFHVLEGLHVPSAAIGRALTLLGYAPRDWIPSDAEGIRAMGSVLEAAVRLATTSGGILDREVLIAPVKGDWTRACQALCRHSPGIDTSATLFAGQMRDMAEAYSTQVLEPATAYAAAATGLSPELAPGLAAAWKALFAGKGIVAVAEANADWHVRGAAMTAVVASLSALATGKWRRPFPDFTASNGRTITPLLSATELVEEGRALNHCVGSYAKGCASGSYAIASVRTPDGARSSTVQITGTGTVNQHSAARNAHPSAEDVEAVRQLLAELARNVVPTVAKSLNERIRAGLAALRRKAADAASPSWAHNNRFPYNPSDPVRVMRAASLWEPYLPRPARGSIASHLAGPAPELSAALAKIGTLRRMGTPAQFARSFLRGLFAKIRNTPLSVRFVLCAILIGWVIYQNPPGIVTPAIGSYRSAEVVRDELARLGQVQKAVQALAEIRVGQRKVAPEVEAGLRTTFTKMNAELPEHLRYPDLMRAVVNRSESIKRGPQTPIPGQGQPTVSGAR